MKFIDRKDELRLLRRNLAGGGLIIVYGRRRVGKTELLKQLPKKNKIYYLVKEQPLGRALEELNYKLAKELGDAELFKNPLNTPEKLFAYLADKKIVFILDEFPLLAKYKEFLGYLQEFLDNKPRATVILCGSYISAMEKIKDYSSPVYGRRTTSLKVSPLSFACLKDFFSHSSREELVKVYGALGGVPEYLWKYQPSFNSFVKDNFFQSNTYLFSEAEFLLRYELRDLSVYNSILKAIAAGYTRLGEIAQKSYIDKSAIVKYLNILISLDIVKKERPYLSNQKKKLKERGALYFLADNYFNFYYTFVYPFKEEIVLGISRPAEEYFRKNFNVYLGHIFEDIAKQFLQKVYGSSFGRQWGVIRRTEKGKTLSEIYEIDLLSVDESRKVIRAFEVKWRDLSLKEAERTARALEQQVKALPVNELADYRIEIGLIAKRIKSKRSLKNKNISVFDINDF